MKNKSKLLGVRIECQTWEMLMALSKFSGSVPNSKRKTISVIVREMLNAYVKQLYDRIPEDKLAEIKGEQ